MDLYARLKQSLQYNHKKDIDDLNQFVEELPHKLKIEVSLFLHEQTYRNIVFLKDRSSSFKAWLCPLLKPYLVMENQYVFFEDDEITSIYFIKGGECGFVLPKHNNAKYIDMEVGSHFGAVDIVGSLLQEGHVDMDDWIKHKDIMKRQFTIMANSNVELLSFSIEDLNRMKMEFLEAYDALFSSSYRRLDRALKMKLKAMKYCQEFFEK